MRKALFAIAGLLLALPGLAFAQFDHPVKVVSLKD